MPLSMTTQKKFDHTKSRSFSIVKFSIFNCTPETEIYNGFISPLEEKDAITGTHIK